MVCGVKTNGVNLKEHGNLVVKISSVTNFKMYIWDSGDPGCLLLTLTAITEKKAGL